MQSIKGFLSLIILLSLISIDSITANACTTNYKGYIHVNEESYGKFKFLLLDIKTGNSYTFNRRIDWDFGDGQTGSGLPTHQYSSQGKYNVTAWSWDTVNNCGDTFIVNICNFHSSTNVTYTKSGNTINVSAICGSNQTFYWSLGDGNDTNACSFSYTYSKADFYNLRLYRVSDTLMGCSDSASYSENIDLTLCGFQANFFFYKTLKNYVVAYAYPFPNNKQPVSGTEIWYWGDNSLVSDSSIKNYNSAEHTYQRSGTYTITHVVIDSAETCSDTFSQSVIIDSCSIVLDFDLYINGKFISVQKKGNASYIGWNFGETSGTQSQSNSANYTYSDTGSYLICLEGNDNSCYKKVCKLIRLGECNLNAYYSYTQDSTNCKRLLFNNLGKSNSKIKYSWDFGDNSFSSLENPNHTFQNNVHYNVRLKLIDTTLSKCRDSILRSVIVSCPNCGINDSLDLYYDSTFPYQANLYNYTSGPVHKHKWLFGDGDSSFQMSPVHTYSITGKILLRYIATDTIKNCSDTFFMTFTIDSTGNIKRKLFTLNIIDRTKDATSISSINSEQTKVYPNPFKSEIYIAEMQFDELENVSLYNAFGQEISVQLKTIDGKYTIRTSENLSKGVYVLCIRTKFGLQNFKLIRE